jgi:hypothetical protein
MAMPPRGSNVVLLEKPSGCISQHYPVTVGKTYKVLDWNGSCLMVTTDVEGETAFIYFGSFIKETAP